MIDIHPIGSVLPVDNAGNIVRVASKDKIVSPWKTAVGYLTDQYIKYLGDNLSAVYVRGSVAKGQAAEGVSDIDTIALVHYMPNATELTWKSTVLKEFRQRYQFADGAEMEILEFDEVLQLNNESTQWYRFVIKTQSVCVWGADIIPKLPSYKLGDSLKVHSSQLEAEIQGLVSDLPMLSPEATKKKCRWIMKRLVRTGYELVMEREQGYTRDLYPCWVGFSRHFTEESMAMRQALSLALNPTSDKQQICNILNTIGSVVARRARQQH